MLISILANIDGRSHYRSYNTLFAAGLKTLRITISGGQEKCCALSYSFVYNSHSSRYMLSSYYSQLYSVNCKGPIFMPYVH